MAPAFVDIIQKMTYIDNIKMNEYSFMNYNSVARKHSFKQILKENGGIEDGIRKI